MNTKVKNIIIENEQLIREQNWRQLWLACSFDDFRLEDFKELESMLNAIGVDYEEGKQEAAFQLLKKIVKNTINSENCAYIATIYYRAKPLEKMGYSTQDIYDMFVKYKTELNIKDITSKLLIFN